VAKLLTGYAKVSGSKNETNLLYHNDKFGGDCMSHAGCFLFLSHFWNYRVYENGNAIKQYNFQILLVPLHRGRILVVHLYSSFYMDPGFSSRGKFIPKIANFVRSKPIFLKP